MTKRPLTLLTTSRRPTNITRTFCRELSNLLPDTIRMNRGKLSTDGIAEKALELGASKVVIIGRWRRGPGKIQLLRMTEKELLAFPPLIYIRNVKLRRDFRNTTTKKKVKTISVLASHGNNLEADRLENAFSKFFSIPILPLTEVRNKRFDAAIQLLTDSSNHTTVAFKLIQRSTETGLQITISHLVWELSHEG